MKNMLAMLRNDDGATMVEYGIMVALIAVACIAIITILGGKIQSTFTNASNALN